LWDEPHPHARMPMMLNNMSEVKHTNKGRYTSCISCVWVWSSSHFMDAQIYLVAFEGHVFGLSVYETPLGYIRTSACIHLVTPFWVSMNPFIIFHCISMFILHWRRNFLKRMIWVWNRVFKKI
jgi:hypothetical protein